MNNSNPDWPKKESFLLEQESDKLRKIEVEKLDNEIITFIKSKKSRYRIEYKEIRLNFPILRNTTNMQMKGILNRILNKYLNINNYNINKKAIFRSKHQSNIKKIKKQNHSILRKVEKAGYIVEDGKILHREIYKTTFGSIPSGWVIHHIDENKQNNNPENLIALPHYLHSLIHKEMWSKNIKFTKKEIEEKLLNYQNELKEISGKILNIKNELKNLEGHKKEMEALFISRR